MFCRNCGTKLPDGGKFCPGCGTPTGAVPPAEEVKPAVEEAAPVEERKETVEKAAPVEECKKTVEESAEEVKETAQENAPASAPVQPPYPPQQQYQPYQQPPQQPYAPQQQYQQPYAPQYGAYYGTQPPQKKKNKLPLILGICAGVVILAILAFLFVPKLLGSKNSKPIDPIDHLFAFINTGDADEFFAAIQPEYFEALADMVGMSVKDMKASLAESITEEMYSYADIKPEASYEIEYSEHLDADDLDEMREDLEYYYNIDGSKITDAIEYELYATLIFGDETEYEYEDFVCYLYDGSWYLWMD